MKNEITNFGKEGKGESNEIDQFNAQFFDKGTTYNIINICGVNPYSRSGRELDLICVLNKDSNHRGSFNPLVEHINKKRIGGNQPVTLEVSDSFTVSTLFFSIEIKAHSPERIVISGDDVYVMYKGKKHSASSKLIEQSIQAKDNLKRFIPHQNIFNTIPLIYFPNAKKSDFELDKKNVRYGVLFRDSTFRDLIECALHHQGIWQKKRDDKLGYLGQKLDFESIKSDIEHYYKKMQPSKIEQERLEFISKKYATKDKSWVSSVGRNPIAFLGKAGTGKTLKLIRLANDVMENSDPVLFLTFNRALASDLGRLTQLQHLNGASNITILTIDKFLFTLAKRFKLYEKDYNEFKKETADEFSAIRSLVLESLENNLTLEKIKNSLFRDFQYVAIDEAQDWFQTERDIIIKIFEPKRIFLAVGTDQCMRSPRLANWSRDFENKNCSHVKVPANISLRLKSNLTSFNNQLAVKLKQDWGIEKNKDMTGGNVIMFNKPTKEIFNDFLEELNDNNPDYFPIDYLVLSPSKDKKNIQLLTTYTNNTEYGFWNGIDFDSDRNSVPGRGDLRGVSLESSRGLEGWSVLVLDVDYWWKWCIYHKRRLKEHNEAFEESDILELKFHGENKFNDITDYDLFELPTWFLIPFTRAKNKLLIQLPEKGKLRDIFLDLHKNNEHFITYINN